MARFLLELQVDNGKGAMPMSQRSVECVLGRLVTDGRFRAEFFEAPDRACTGERLELSDREMRALLRIDEDVLVAFAAGVDPRLWRERPTADDV